ncbi:DUF881 domain-containing protein [Bacillus tuaregi]|uniref:DUF881 domain-containing protein n=1 Tax=Bacillus tuaregi TaxID=1816695 RepID=UPI0008F847A7|nr:DUF881 domain-containing protein [Bacillus tuaregi]
MNQRRSLKGRYVILTIVFLVFGFLIAFSYHLTDKQTSKTTMTSSQFERDMELRNELITQEEKNLELKKELNQKQEQVLKIEKELSNEAEVYYNLAEDIEKYRMYLGKVKVKGEGVQVTLADGDYNLNEHNPNQYIVHEHHIFKVITELNISGASAIAINGQRLSHDSYVLCNGPVIVVDGKSHPAPFVITAIGDAGTMAESLNLKGGVKDILVNENVQFTLEKKDEIEINAKLNS